MSSLSPRTQALLRAGRAGHEPSPEQLARVRLSLVAKLGGVGAAAVGVGATTASASAALSVPLIAKVFVGVGVMALAGLGGLHWVRSSGGSDALPLVQAVEHSPGKAVVAAPRATAPQPPSISLGTAAPSSAPSQTVTVPRAVSNAPAAPARLAQDALLEEARLLGQAQKQLGSGAAGGALQTLAEYERRFSAGSLRAEADAVRVFALCQSGRSAEARTAAERFVRRYPASPSASRVQKACSASKR